MKYIILSVVALISISDALGQGFYLKGGIGNAIPVAGQTLDVNGNPFNGTITYTYSGTTKENFDVKKASFSAGFQGQLALGYMFNQHVGVEVNVTIIVPTKYTAHEDSAQNPVGSDIYNAVITRQSSLPIVITPSLVYNTGGKHFQGYARGGMALPFNTKITEEQNYLSGFPSFTSPEYIRLETTSKFGVGFSGAIGIQYIASKNISIWLETNLLSMSLYASQSLITDHTLDGVNSTREPVAGTIIKYRTNGNFSGTNQPIYSIPFSNAGISIGVKISLAKSKEDNSNTGQTHAK